MKSEEWVKNKIEELEFDCKYRHTDYFDIDRALKLTQIKILEEVLED